MGRWTVATGATQTAQRAEWNPWQRIANAFPSRRDGGYSPRENRRHGRRALLRPSRASRDSISHSTGFAPPANTQSSLTRGYIPPAPPGPSRCGLVWYNESSTTRPITRRGEKRRGIGVQAMGRSQRDKAKPVEPTPLTPACARTSARGRKAAIRARKNFPWNRPSARAASRICRDALRSFWRRFPCRRPIGPRPCRRRPRS